MWMCFKCCSMLVLLIPWRSLSWRWIRSASEINEKLTTTTSLHLCCSLVFVKKLQKVVLKGMLCSTRKLMNSTSDLIWLAECKEMDYTVLKDVRLSDVQTSEHFKYLKEVLLYFCHKSENKTYLFCKRILIWKKMAA